MAISKNIYSLSKKKKTAERKSLQEKYFPYFILFEISELGFKHLFVYDKPNTTYETRRLYGRKKSA